MFKKAAWAFSVLVSIVPFAASAATCPPLTLGSTGARVVAVQTILQGAYTNFPAPTGYFGPLTEAALKQWQEEHGISPVGVVGPLTAAAMKLSCTTVTSITSPIATAPSNPAVTPSASPEQARTLVRGLSGADVLALQQFLISQGLLSPDSATGYFGVLTESAVKAFQAKSGIASSGSPATTGFGVVGPKTQATMSIARTMHLNTPRSPAAPQSPTNPAPPTTAVYVPPTKPIIPPTPTPPIVPSAPSSCSFNGQSIASGTTVTAYQSASVASGSQCVSQNRVCSNGVLSGTYTNASCNVTGLAAPSCSISYTPSSVSSGQPYVINWTSQNATSRLYSVKKPDGAYLVQNGGVAIGAGTFTDTTASSQLAPGIYTRTDTVTGAGGTATCAAAITITVPSSAASCSFNGQNVAHGASVTAYQASSVAYGNQCASQTRTCTNGTLSGSYTNAACTVAAPSVSYKTCGTIPAGDMTHEIGNAYQNVYFVKNGDTSQAPSSSHVMVFENGTAMGPAHAAHQSVRDSGNGRFSHWYDALYLSATDNTDPRTNNRVYTYGVPTGEQCPIPTPNNKDQAASLQHWIDLLPDGATLSFPANATYIINSRLFLVARSNLTWEGNGATLRSTIARGNASMVEFSKGTNIVMRNMTIDGGRPSGTYDPQHEAEFAVGARGVNGLELDHMQLKNSGGDCVLIDAYNGAPVGPQSSNISIHDSQCTNSGRMGVAVTGASNVSILRNTFSNVGIHVIDCEPDYPQFGCQNLRVDSNNVLSYGAGSNFGPWFFVIGVVSNAVSDIVVTNNTIHGPSPYFIEVYRPASSNAVWRNITITGNTADSPNSLIQVLNVTNLIMNNNTNATIYTEGISSATHVSSLASVLTAFESLLVKFKTFLSSGN